MQWRPKAWDKSGNGGPTPDPKKFVVGFDTRFLSDRYAGEVARVLAANGFIVYLAQSDAPTPAISSAVKNLGCHCRGNDHRLPQCPALQRRQAQSRLRRARP